MMNKSWHENTRKWSHWAWRLNKKWMTLFRAGDNEGPSDAVRRERTIYCNLPLLWYIEIYC